LNQRWIRLVRASDTSDWNHFAHNALITLTDCATAPHNNNVTRGPETIVIKYCHEKSSHGCCQNDSSYLLYAHIHRAIARFI